MSSSRQWIWTSNPSAVAWANGGIQNPIFDVFEEQSTLKKIFTTFMNVVPCLAKNSERKVTKKMCGIPDKKEKLTDRFQCPLVSVTEAIPPTLALIVQIDLVTTEMHSKIFSSIIISV